MFGAGQTTFTKPLCGSSQVAPDGRNAGVLLLPCCCRSAARRFAYIPRRDPAHGTESPLRGRTARGRSPLGRSTAMACAHPSSQSSIGHGSLVGMAGANPVDDCGDGGGWLGGPGLGVAGTSHHWLATGIPRSSSACTSSWVSEPLSRYRQGSCSGVITRRCCVAGESAGPDPSRGRCLWVGEG